MRKGEVLVKKGGCADVIRDVRFSGLLRKAFALYKKQKALDGELLGMKLRILKRSGGYMEDEGGLVFKTPGAVLSIHRRCESFVPEENLPALRAALGRDFGRLVKVQRKYLINGGPLRGKAARLIKRKELSPRFRWTDK